MDEDLSDEIMSIVNKSGVTMDRASIPYEDSIILLENDKVSVKLILKELSGRKPNETNIDFDYINFYILLQIKN